ncbi:hypothetical protein AAY80_243 [Stenotrophomonas phage vB_SmaS-DLP_6]|nr:hypothetical protein AAY80_243 [Stenotrophomonas phage vB_SmaS-DLP_6]
MTDARNLTMKTASVNAAATIAANIVTGEYSNDDLNAIINAINVRRRQVAAQKQLVAKVALRVGQVVSFNSKYGKINGAIAKICPKNVQVTDTQGRRWTVSPTLLTVVGKVSVA